MNFRIVLVLLYLVVGINIYAQDANRDSVTKLYVASFDRAPDSSGLRYWVEESNLTLEEIAESFFEQSETKEMYPNGFGDANFVDSVYSNLFKRTPDSSGREYWIKQIESGNISPSLFILAVINGAINSDATILDNKSAVGLEFAKSGSDNIKKAYSVMSGVSEESDSVITAFAEIDGIVVDGVCDNNTKNSCDNGSVVGDYESDDYYIWFCQGDDGKVSNQCQHKKESNIAECDNSSKNSCKSGTLIVENQNSEYYLWYCKADTISPECKIKKGDAIDSPQCNNAVKNSCEVGDVVDSTEDNDFYYWYCEVDDKISGRCKIEKEPLAPECSDNEYKCIVGLVEDISGSADFEDKFMWSCRTELDTIECEKKKEEKIIEIEAKSIYKNKWTPLDCYDYSGESRDQGYLVQFDYREYAKRCASSVEVESYNTKSFNEDKLISTLKREKLSKQTENFCEKPYSKDENGTEYKYEFNSISKSSCLKTIYE